MNVPAPRQYGGPLVPLQLENGRIANYEAVKRGLLVGLVCGSPEVFEWDQCEAYCELLLPRIVVKKYPQH